MKRRILSSEFQGTSVKAFLPEKGTISLLIVAFAFCLSCSTSQRGVVSNRQLAEGWEIVKQEKQKSASGWTIYSRSKAGSKVKEFKIKGTINVTPDKAIRALRERTENSEKYIEEKEGYIKILSSSENELLVYSVYNTPFPFKAREMCERFLFEENKETGVHRISWKEDWQSAPPPDKDLVRMHTVRGSWEFVPLESGRSQATYIVHAEPGGKIPAWMANATVSKGLPDELKNVEEAAMQLPE